MASNMNHHRRHSSCMTIILSHKHTHTRGKKNPAVCVAAVDVSFGKKQTVLLSDFGVISKVSIDFYVLFGSISIVFRKTFFPRTRIECLWIFGFFDLFFFGSDGSERTINSTRAGMLIKDGRIIEFTPWPIHSFLFDRPFTYFYSHHPTWQSTNSCG